MISSFQSDINKYIVTNTMKECALDPAEAAYEKPGEQAPMGFMALGRKIKVSENTHTYIDRKHSSLPSLNGTENTN